MKLFYGRFFDEIQKQNFEEIDNIISLKEEEGYFDSDCLFKDLSEKYHIELLNIHWDDQSIGTCRRYKKKELISSNRRLYQEREFFEYQIQIPFEGNPILFETRGSSWSESPITGEIKNHFLILKVIVENQNKTNFERALNRVISKAKDGERDINIRVEHYNNYLITKIQNSIKDSNNFLEDTVKIANSLGIPFKKLDNPVEIPLKSKKIIIKDKIGTNSSIEDKMYLELLKTLARMSYLMERNPFTFNDAKEELIRDHFLVQLNGNYELDSTGETFNGKGKTDILVKYKGFNIFIAECKLWKGKKYSVVDAIEQIMKYVRWNDTKNAILIFNQDVQFSKILAEIEADIESSDYCERKLDLDLNESKIAYFPYIFHYKADPSIKMNLTFLLFDLKTN
ncbi:hypothetical protein [Candidatus Lokiarchaeum ossiferum]|uniref:hypothetical protein n=1 Tax=Candidatus Lokiarchaeum ossiferum TaxID=2951803 RepID=UPI00352F6F70